jgi:hypothetical protein
MAKEERVDGGVGIGETSCIFNSPNGKFGVMSFAWYGVFKDELV